MKRFLALVLAPVLAVLVGIAPIQPSEGLGTAVLYFSPSTKTVQPGEAFSVIVYVSSQTEYINSAEATINFPTNLLDVTSVSSSGIFSLWAQTPTYSNSSGRVSFAGGLPSPGYKGSGGRLVTINFKAAAAGTAQLTMSGASVLRNDANGTNILSATRTATITVASPSEPAPPPPSTPGRSAPTFSSPLEQSKWYKERNISISWSAGTGVRGYSSVFDQNPSTVPPQTSQGLTSSFTRENLEDGEWYLHVRAQYDDGWSSTSTFRFGIDGTAPEPFTITIIGDPVANFETSDKTSGIDHYEVSIDGGDFAAASSPYTTPELEVGKHTLTVRAFDKAGNYREASVEFEVTGYPQPVIIDLTPVVFGDQPVVIRGYSNAQDTLRLTIDDATYGPFPVEDNLDPSPPVAPPEGKVAWKLEVRANVSAGAHDVSLVALGPDGEISPSTPPVSFKIVTNALKIFGWIVPTVLIINLLFILFLLALAVAIYFAWRYRRLARKSKSSNGSGRTAVGGVSESAPYAAQQHDRGHH